jgi:tetratricopeptide (TPR) repeat protein
MRTDWNRCALVLLAIGVFAWPSFAQKKREPAQPAAPTARELIDEANKAMKTGDDARAVKIYDQARKAKDFSNARPTPALVFAAGDYHFAAGTKESMEEALAIYSTVIDSGQAATMDRALARVKRAEVLLRQDKAQMAKDEVNAVRGMSSNRKVALMADLGDASIQLHLGQAEAARDRLLPLLESDEPVLQAMAMFSLGRAYVQLKQPEQAVTIFRKLWAKYGETDYVKRAVFLVGGIYLDRGDFMEARKLYEACSVIGASMQTRVQPGEELIIKASDPNYFARTRSLQMPVTLTAPSGDREVIKLDKNPVSDVLYTGRVETALATAVAKDGTLQVRGGDEIEMTYDGQVSAPRKVLVVDDGRINVDSVPMADPPARHKKEMTQTIVRKKPADEEETKPILPTGRQAAGSLNPGSPVYVQVVDADLDKTDGIDTMTAHVIAHGAKGDGASLKVTLKETGPRTGIFAGSVPTAQGYATISASSEATGHPATDAMDVDSASPAPGQKIDPAKATVRTTYWKGKPGEKTYSIEVDLRQAYFLGKLTWGPGSDPKAENNAPTAMNVVLRGDNVEKTIPVNGKPNLTYNTIDLGGVFARYVRFDITKWGGDSPAIGQIIITDQTGKQLVPTGIDPDENAKKGVLEFDVGQTVSAKYIDELNETPGIPTMRESRRLGASYHNAAINIASRFGGGDAKKPATFSAMWRLDLNAEPHVVVTDPDMDTTVSPDKLALDIFTEAGTKRTLEVHETGPATGTFSTALPVTDNAAAKDDPRLLYVRPGDLVWMTYMDERNLTPGYRTFRHYSLLENRPTAGEFAPLLMLQTAWPYEAKGEGAEVPVTQRSAFDGRVNISLHDPDALSRAGQTVAVKTSALLSGTAQELTLAASASGTASKMLELVLGDKDIDRALGGEPSGNATELSVAGDDLIRIAYSDAKVATNDLQMRRVFSEQELKAMEKAAETTKPEAVINAVPLVRLRDPQRRLQADMDARLKEFRAEMNYRLAAYADETKLLIERRDLLKTRLVDAPPAKATDVARVAAEEALKASIAVLDAQIEMLNQRCQRLKAMGSAADRTRLEAKTHAAPEKNEVAAVPSEADKIKAVQDGPLIPGQAFEITVDDADLTSPEIDVRVRSVSGRMVDLLQVKAQRDATGLYKARVETEQSGDAGDPKMLSLMPGGEIIVDYTDAVQKDPGKVDRVTYLTLASDANLEALNPNFTDPINEVRLGEVVHIQVIDFDQDRTPAQDRIIVTAKSAQGDSLSIVCSETEAHSGVFRGVFVTDRGKPNPSDEILQADYGGTIDLSYADYLRVSPGSDAIKTVRLQISGGADGTVEGFSRQFRNAKDEMQLWYRTGQAAYQLGRKLYLNGSVERAEENFAEATDYFSQLVNRFPADPLAASSNYYLGNIQAIKGHHHEALARFQEIVAKWPKSEFVARSRFKIGESYEAMGQFDQAADAYVLLTYHHPEDANVPTAMIRMMNYYARSEAWSDAVAIAEKFVEKFPDHPQAGEVALQAGNWLVQADKINEALAWFVKSEKVFATKDKEMPALLYWHAATLISSNKGSLRGNAPRADKVKELFNRVVYDYPNNEFVPLAKIALEQLAEKK